MREPRYSLLADIQYDIELARQGKFALYGQRNIAREYRCKKATPEEQQAYETLQNVLFMVPQWSDTEELHSDIVKLTNRDLRISFCLEKGLEVSSLQFFGIAAFTSSIMGRRSSSFIPGILSISAEVRCHIRWYGVVSLAALSF